MAPIRRITGAVLLTCMLTLSGMYFTFFHHPPPEEILSNQGGQLLSADEFNLDPSKSHTMAEISRAAWGKWIYDNKYVSIGDIYDAECDDPEKVTIGKTILQPDKKNGGVMATIYINTTIETAVIYGEIHVIALYNGKELYNSRLDLCTAEEGDEVQILKCPIAKGNHYLIKENKIPSLLPKGEYKVSASVTNQDKKLVMCATMTFVL